MIFNIQRYSLHDGSGIRTVVFFKGCTLRCRWCSNPESQEFFPELQYSSRLCIGCGDCAKMAADGEISHDGGELIIRREKVSDASTFRNACPAGALSVAGYDMSIDDLLREIEKDRLFHCRGGGLTLSGGEPFAQPDFATELLRRAKEAGMNTAVETCLQVPRRHIERCLPWVDALLADLKHVDPVKYHQETEGDLRIVEENWNWLAGLRSPALVARIPVIPGFNDCPSERDAILRRIAALKRIKEINIMPFHTLGAGKCAALGREWPYEGTPAMESEDLAEWITAAEKLGLAARIGG